MPERKGAADESALRGHALAKAADFRARLQLSNALKYSPPDDVVRIASRRRDDGALEVTISDSGQGMTREEIAQAGRPFTQLDRRDQQRTQHPSKRGNYASPGTGLGFPLVVKLMEAHGGRAEIASERGKGCTVNAVFPGERVI